MEGFRPTIVCFSCNFGWGYLVERQTLPARIPYFIPVTCSGKVDAAYILTAFKKGADGVLILGCPEGHCHFQDGNYRAAKRMYLLQNMLGPFGIAPERVRIVLDFDPEGRKIVQHLQEMAGELRILGPAGIA